MDQFQQKLVGQLFATATKILEDAHQPSTRGQSSHVTKGELQRLAKLLVESGENLRNIGDAVAVVLRRKS